jgi:hypothetical protein
MSQLTVVLNESTGHQIGYAPLTLTLNPSGYSVADGPIVQIEYDFKDGTDPVIVKRKLNTDSLPTSAYAFPGDPGDPRNVIVTHTLFPSVTADPQVFNISVKVTKATTFRPVEYIVPMNVFKVNAIDGIGQGFFEDVHLVGARVSGMENTKLYTFETVNPRYLTFLTHADG